jgi:tetratricopeptide (TPR) repeat protein
MALNIPIIRQIAWISVVPQALLILLIIYIYDLLGFSEPALWGAATSIILSFGLRNLIAKSHRQGIKLVKEQKFKDAISFFEESVTYFSKNKWVDKYRFLTLLSSSKMCYREMGLCNIAFCHSQIGNGLKAKEIYQQVLTEYPENRLASVALNMLNSIGQNE